MPGKRVLLKHVIESRIELLPRHLPRDQRTLRQICCEQSLTHTADRSPAQHGLNALDNDGQFDTRLARNFSEWIALKALHPILGDREDRGVDRIRKINRDRW